MELLNSIILLLLVVFILLLAWSFILKLKKKQDNKELKTDTTKNTNIKKIKDSRKLLYEVNKLTRKFFKDYLNLKNELTYSELSKILRERRENRMADYCDRLDYYLYSGSKRTIEEVKVLLEQFKAITLEAEAKNKAEVKK